MREMEVQYTTLDIGGPDLHEKDTRDACSVGSPHDKEYPNADPVSRV